MRSMRGSKLAAALLALCALAPLVKPALSQPDWRETREIRVLMSSTADWARIMFDDANGTNTNGIRFKAIKDYGWILKHDDDDIIDVGVDITWHDILYGGESVNKTGDIVAFFKGNWDFAYTIMYADIIFEVDASKPQVYVYLMVAGRGTTTFELLDKKTGTTLWRETVSGDGQTQHIKRYLPTAVFLQTSNLSSMTALSMIAITSLILLGLNFPRVKRRAAGRLKKRD